ncbi:hypothetical protein G4B88_006653 [Cannabis sativa]|uniref:Ubiquitin-like protease family profile domain-containing protein n=1 Tax=Cannabis sativa TaxID=3483 RepID=A0A7J6GGE0_CANSA|nr:hypothetical protein G4B88_006653 [Cannabis sativa]
MSTKSNEYNRLLGEDFVDLQSGVGRRSGRVEDNEHRRQRLGFFVRERKLSMDCRRRRMMEVLRTEFFSSPIREAYYQDISDDGGGLQLSVHTVQAKEEKDTLNFENMFIDPDFLKGVVDSTVKSALKTDDVSFHDDSDKLSLVLYDESYLSPEIQKRQPKPSSVVLSPYVVDFGSSSSSKEDLMRIVQDDKFIVHGINPFKDEIGFNTGAEQCIKFSKFIDENIVMNRGVKKYSDADNILSPPMDFSFIEISEKMWFYELHACGEFLRVSHLDVVFYYLRKKIKQDDTLNQRITTTDCLFDQVMWNSYNQFLKSGSNPSKIDFDNVILRYIVGEYLFCNTPWVLTDHVLIYVNIQKQKHWILVHFDIKERMLNVYNSMSGALNKKRALDHVKAYSTMLPFYLEYLDVYSSRPDLNLDQGPYSVGKREPLNFKFIDGLPSQVNRLDVSMNQQHFVIPMAVSQLVFLILVATLFFPCSQICVRNWFFMIIKKQFKLEMHIFGVDRCSELKNSFSALRGIICTGRREELNRRRWRSEL